jgi:hypothetical protein
MESTHRTFIKQTAFTSTAIGLVSIVQSHVWAAKYASSDKINVALIGCHSMRFGNLQNHLGFGEVNCH